jgi:predicted TIM-barrel fold metal-dependent hydrolase
MRYTRISADCHIDLCWLPPDLFTSSASAAMKDRMPYVTDGPKGPVWVTKKGAKLGLMNGMGSAGREYVPGKIHRSDRMATTGLYEDGKRGIRRLTDPELRLKDQERDGVQAEVLYGILGATRRLNDPEAAVELVRIYNEWLAGFCDAHTDRYAGLACIPNAPVEAAVEEIRRVIKRGGVRGLEIAHSYDIAPFWDPQWNPVWEVANEVALPVHFHTAGERRPDLAKLPPQLARVEHAVHISGFQLYMATTLISVIFAGVLERWRNVKIVIGESGIGWIPYVLDRMDAEWEDQFKDLSLTMRPSEYWRRQCRATYQSDRIGIKLLDDIGHDTIMWGSDFPHPDGVWPDSNEFIERDLGHLPAEVRHKLVCENAGRLYGFIP